MMQRFLLSRRSMLFSLVGLLITTMLSIWGCGGSSSSYTDPAAVPFTNATPTALIEPATLKTWIDEGKVNAPLTNTNRVVIVAVGTAASYADGHIPGAVFLDSGTLNLTRTEGATQIGTMVMNGPTIDANLQNLGITKYSTIVLANHSASATTTASDNAMNVSRVYFTLRYWGFPKERIKVLNGGEAAWAQEYTNKSWSAAYAITTNATAFSRSTFSVKELYNGSNTNNFALRTSIGEMISLVDSINAGTITTGASGSVVILDERGDATVGKHPYIANAALSSGALDSHANYYGTLAGSFKPVGDATTAGTLKYNLAGFGVTDSSKTIYVYCASGMRASTAFFVLDGILGWPVKLYDGSWNQWSGYTSLAAATNKVAPRWQTNLLTANTPLNRTEGVALYEASRPTTGATNVHIGAALTLDALGNGYEITDPRANQMLLEDKAYFTTPAVNTTTGAGGEGSGC